MFEPRDKKIRGWGWTKGECEVYSIWKLFFRAHCTVNKWQPESVNEQDIFVKAWKLFWHTFKYITRMVVFHRFDNTGTSRFFFSKKNYQVKFFRMKQIWNKAGRLTLCRYEMSYWGTWNHAGIRIKRDPPVLRWRRIFWSTITRLLCYAGQKWIHLVPCTLEWQTETMTGTFILTAEQRDVSLPCAWFDSD